MVSGVNTFQKIYKASERAAGVGIKNVNKELVDAN
jgi:hypothetical protein